MMLKGYRKVVKMKLSLLLGGSVAAAAVFLAGAPSADAAQRAACSLLTLAEVRAIVAAPVDVYAPGSAKPTMHGQTTISNCTYITASASGRGARLTLMWGPAAKLAQTDQYYQKRHKELPSIKGDVLVLASVTNSTQAGLTFDQPASKKLLDAALKKL